MEEAYDRIENLNFDLTKFDWPMKIIVYKDLWVPYINNQGSSISVSPNPYTALAAYNKARIIIRIISEGLSLDDYLNHSNTSGSYIWFNRVASMSATLISNSWNDNLLFLSSLQ